MKNELVNSKLFSYLFCFLYHIGNFFANFCALLGSFLWCNNYVQVYRDCMYIATAIFPTTILIAHWGTGQHRSTLILHSAGKCTSNSCSYKIPCKRNTNLVLLASFSPLRDYKFSQDQQKNKGFWVNTYSSKYNFSDMNLKKLQKFKLQKFKSKT